MRALFLLLANRSKLFGGQQIFLSPECFLRLNQIVKRDDAAGRSEQVHLNRGSASRECLLCEFQQFCVTERWRITDW